MAQAPLISLGVWGRRGGPAVQCMREWAWCTWTAAGREGWLGALAASLPAMRACEAQLAARVAVPRHRRPPLRPPYPASLPLALPAGGRSSWRTRLPTSLPGTDHARVRRAAWRPACARVRAAGPAARHGTCPVPSSMLERAWHRTRSHLWGPRPALPCPALCAPPASALQCASTEFARALPLPFLPVIPPPAVRIHEIVFKRPVEVGDLINFQARVLHTWTSEEDPTQARTRPCTRPGCCTRSAACICPG